MHSCVKLDVDRETFYSPGLERRNQSFEGKHVGNSGLEAIVDYLVEEISTGGKHKDWKADTGLAKLDAFNRERHSEIVRSGILHHKSEFDSAVTISVRLD